MRRNTRNSRNRKFIDPHYSRYNLDNIHDGSIYLLFEKSRVIDLSNSSDSSDDNNSDSSDNITTNTSRIIDNNYSNDSDNSDSSDSNSSDNDNNNNTSRGRTIGFARRVIDLHKLAHKNGIKKSKKSKRCGCSRNRSYQHCITCNKIATITRVILDKYARVSKKVKFNCNDILNLGCDVKVFIKYIDAMLDNGRYIGLKWKNYGDNWRIEFIERVNRKDSMRIIADKLRYDNFRIATITTSRSRLL
jgi:hypothetical protein